jgi:ferric-dicitrate binding protein FerR (iron transport regulator)
MPQQNIIIIYLISVQRECRGSRKDWVIKFDSKLCSLATKEALVDQPDQPPENQHPWERMTAVNDNYSSRLTGL